MSGLCGVTDVTLRGERIGSLPTEDASWIRPLVRIGHTPKLYLDRLAPGEGYKGKAAVKVVIAHFDKGIRAYQALQAEAPAGYGIRPASAGSFRSWKRCARTGTSTAWKSLGNRKTGQRTTI